MSAPPRPDRPPEPHLHVRSVDGLLGVALAATGNRVALLQLRRQIDRALAGRDEDVPFEEEVYRDVHGQPFELAVKLARSPGEMREPIPKPEKTRERMPWAEEHLPAGCEYGLPLRRLTRSRVSRPLG